MEKIPRHQDTSPLRYRPIAFSVRSTLYLGAFCQLFLPAVTKEGKNLVNWTRRTP